MLQGPWCTGYLKRDVLKHYYKTTGEHREYVGIAADETKRIIRAKNKGQILPLVDYKITENTALNICYKHNLLSPIYKTQKRNGCWFCHNQRLSELKNLRKNYPELWNKLLKLQNDSPILFRPTASLHEIENRFKNEEM